jgi:hypothetical protein
MTEKQIARSRAALVKKVEKAYTSLSLARERRGNTGSRIQSTGEMKATHRHNLAVRALRAFDQEHDVK